MLTMSNVDKGLMKRKLLMKTTRPSTNILMKNSSVSMINSMHGKRKFKRAMKMLQNNI